MALARGLAVSRLAGGRARRVASRLASALVTVLGLTFVTYVAMTALPGDPLASRRGDESAGPLSETQRRLLERDLGLDRPLLVRYATWLAGCATGDFGVSARTGRPVSREIRERLAATLELNAAALLLVLGIGLPLGWWSARRAGSWPERSTSLTLLTLYALPAFWIAMVLQQLLAVRWGVLPIYGRTSAAVDAAAWDRLAHLVLPALTLAVHGLAFYARFARDTAAEGLESRHALAARASGLRPGRLFLQHGVRPSLVPLATLLGLSIPVFATGSLLIETVFAWPGLGRLFVGAVLGRDLPVVLALTALAGCLTVAGSLVADALSALADPRARTSAATDAAVRAAGRAS